MHVGVAQGADATAAVDTARFHEHVPGLAAIGAAVHPQSAADGARDAAVERQPGNGRVLGSAGHLHIGHRGAGANACATFDGDVAEATAEPDHGTGNAAVADDEV